MTERHRLPNRRGHEVVEFQHGGFAYVAGVGRFDDGSLAELFIHAAKSGTSIESQARDLEIVSSIGLQHGVALETLRHALSRDHNGAATPLCALLDILAGGDA